MIRNTVAFLIDEDLTRRIQIAVWHRNAGIDILRIGDTGAPTYGTFDQDVLLFAEGTGRMLVTEDKRTMRGAHGHLSAHFAQQRHTCGVAFVRPNAPLSRIADILVLLLN